MDSPALLEQLKRIGDALERLAPQPARAPSLKTLGEARAFVWQASEKQLLPVRRVQALPLELLVLDPRLLSTLRANTERFAQGLPANNALLWGPRGTGKSSLVKALHAEISPRSPSPFLLVELEREDLATLPTLLDLLADLEARALLFLDDLSFEADDAAYKSLKVVLDGGLRGRPENVLLYATSNRRHLMPRDMRENTEGKAARPGETMEEKLSLSDRFGLWLGFPTVDQTAYLAMIRAYLSHFGLDIAEETWRPRALEWSMTRGARSGRVAWQFVTDLAGELGRPL